MSRLLRSGRGPAVVASALVLAAAAVGTALAATGDGKPAPKHQTARASRASTKRTIDREIRKLAPRLHVAYAKNSNNARRSASSVAVDSVHKTGVVTANVGQRVNLITIGPFTFSLLCRQGDPTATAPPEGSVVGEVDVSSSEDKSAIESSSTSQAATFPAGVQFPITDRSTALPADVKRNPDEPNFDGDGGFFTAVAPVSGTVVSGDAYVGTHIAGHDCISGLFVMN